MKRMMYLSVSLLCLSLTLLIGFHLGVSTVSAQGGSIPAVGLSGSNGVVLENGDVYSVEGISPNGGSFTPVYRGNIFSGSPINVEQTTWGAIKKRGN